MGSTLTACREALFSIPRSLRNDLCASERRSRGESLFRFRPLPAHGSRDTEHRTRKVAQGKSSGNTFGYIDAGPPAMPQQRHNRLIWAGGVFIPAAPLCHNYGALERATFALKSASLKAGWGLRPRHDCRGDRKSILKNERKRKNTPVSGFSVSTRACNERDARHSNPQEYPLSRSTLFFFGLPG